jgi:hypothetical protein
MADNKTVEQLQAELNEANAKLVNALPDPVAKPKPYTKAEIAAHEKNGHMIGNPNQKLSEGHNPEDLKEWEQWECEVTLKDIGKIPETSQEHAVPESITPLKPQKIGLTGNNKTFQAMNKQIDFRHAGVGRNILYYLPKGALKAAQKYPAHYGIEVVTEPGGKTSKQVRMYVEACHEITGVTKGQG